VTGRQKIAADRHADQGMLSLNRQPRRRMLAAVGIGLAGELGAIGLLATGAWLLLSAWLRPPILLLSVAVGAVQLFSFLRGTARYGERLASHNLGLGLQAGLRSWLYRRLERLVPAGLPGGDRGDLLTRLITDTEETQDLVVRAAVPVLVAGTAWCAAVITVGALLPAAGWALLAAGVLGTAGVAATVIVGDRKAAALPAARGSVGAWVLGVLSSGEELVALGAVDWALDQLAERERALGSCTRAVATATGVGRAAAVLAGGAGTAGVAWAAAAALRAGRIGPVELGVLVFLALGVTALLQGLPDAVSRLPVSRASLERLASLGRIPSPVAEPSASSPTVPLSTTPGRTVNSPGSPPSLAEPAGPTIDGPGHPPDPAPAPTFGRGQARARRGVPAVVLRGAAVGYRDRYDPGPGLGGVVRLDVGHVQGAGPGQRTVISGLNLELVPGRPVALAGPSGSGKTSVLFALLRFIELTAGRMTIGGTDARELSSDRVRALLAWSPEQPALFPTSLRANLRVGAPHATDGQIANLLGQLQLGPWLDRLDEGLDTVLAPWGHPVSGGEIQRLSVARALLADRPVLLLDEPTSHLDAATADKVLEAVLERARNRSLLWVTHRPAELALFPQVCSLRSGPG
jgi:ABC-type transport system involved in cytochrome bd biosynthesis fused ATPase/permease subunit